jgi:hypothetical protein
MKSACFFRRIIFPGLFLVFTWVSSQTLLFAEPLIYYTLTESKAGDQSLQILLPDIIEMNASNAEERVRAVFGQVKLLRPAIYKPVSLILDGRFASTKAVQIEGIRVTGPDLDVLVAELYHTLTIHGVKIIRIPAFSSEPIRADMVRYTAMVPVIPVWEALPPNRANTGFVLVGDEAMSAEVVLGLEMLIFQSPSQG